eukprot:CAMPEP_0198254064 /NCGR_PEP_ID=MMETSP1447-20131203/4438_1 /TAXON_ID=420782 /ORGANISM="Chaetoceros dichaeta, Strain CCMP1751" /LENGTH=366 /DNA_ID=CAMNT_0043939979 /DNA_START=78 /DNA_END=1178 /DNA_ORIENTATION=+
MGGDGGVVATNRLYMRGAGSADHTADSSRASSKDVAEAEKERLQQTMRMCAITGTPFVFTPSNDACVVAAGGDRERSSGSSRPPHVGGIVACPYGRLYTREAAVHALVRRMEQHGSCPQAGEGDTTPEIGWHVRGLRDLHPVRFYVVDQSTDDAGAGKSGGGGGTDDRVFFPACPIAGTDLNGLHPTYLITHKKTKTKKKKKDKKGDNDQDSQDSEGPNVLSEKALKEMGFDSLQEEYGTFQKDDLIRLAPPVGPIFDEIREELTLRRDRESLTTTTKKKRKVKPSNGGGNGEVRPEGVVALSVVPTSKRPRSSMCNSAIGRVSTADVVRKNVAAAVASSAALSSLFADKRSHLSEKEKNNNLFVR